MSDETAPPRYIVLIAPGTDKLSLTPVPPSNTDHQSAKKHCIRELAEEAYPRIPIPSLSEFSVVSPIFEHIRDLQAVLSSISLPSKWFAQDLFREQYQIIFARFDEHGRLSRSASYSLSLVPRVSICNERCLEQQMDLVQDKSKEAVEQRLEEVNELKICKDIKLLPPARASEYRKACELVVLKKEIGAVCRTCMNFRNNLQQKERRESKRDANFLRAKEYLDELCSK